METPVERLKRDKYKIVNHASYTAEAVPPMWAARSMPIALFKAPWSSNMQSWDANPMTCRQMVLT